MRRKGASSTPPIEEKGKSATDANKGPSICINTACNKKTSKKSEKKAKKNKKKKNKKRIKGKKGNKMRKGNL